MSEPSAGQSRRGRAWQRQKRVRGRSIRHIGDGTNRHHPGIQSECASRSLLLHSCTPSPRPLSPPHLPPTIVHNYIIRLLNRLMRPPLPTAAEPLVTCADIHTATLAGHLPTRSELTDFLPLPRPCFSRSSMHTLCFFSLSFYFCFVGRAWGTMEWRLERCSSAGWRGYNLNFFPSRWTHPARSHVALLRSLRAGGSFDGNAVALIVRLNEF